jgi:hypothetical protein
MTDDHNAALSTAWESFCDQVKANGRLAFRENSPDTPLVRAEGVRYVARYIAKALDREVNYADPLYPQFWQYQTPTSKSFGDNPDCTYLDAAVDGAHEYRITGNRGTVAWVSFTVGGYALNNRELKTEWDGSFVLDLGGPQKAGNWLKLDPGLQRVRVRQFFGDWDTEEPMRIRIERVGADGPPPPLAPQVVIEGLKNAASWMAEDSSRWPKWVDSFQENPNIFTSGTPKWVGSDGAAALLGRTLNFCGWRIEPDEALVIDVTPPANCAYWNYELGDRWWNSVDYRYRLSSLNGHQAEVEPDGSVWTVVSHRDPGIRNWLDTGGNTQGSVNQRWVEADGHPIPQARLVAFDKLDTLLPETVRRMGPEDRQEQLRRRKIGVDRRFPL